MSYDVTITDRGLGYNLPQRIGRALWIPMWLMALASFGVGFVLSLVRADAIASGAPDTTIQAHLVPAFMFLGFASVFAAISFAIARILGAFRKGGGEVQEAAGTKVHTLKMPASAKAFIVSMAMAMMILLAAVVAHFVWAAWTATGQVTVAASEQAAVFLEGVRRFGVGVYLLGILYGLASITVVLRFQADRIARIPDEVGT